MTFKYRIRLLVQYEIVANSFNEALGKAGKASLGQNNADAKNGMWHYINSNEKRYVLNNNNELIEVETFGKFPPLTVINPKE